MGDLADEVGSAPGAAKDVFLACAGILAAAWFVSFLMAKQAMDEMR